MTVDVIIPVYKPDTKLVDSLEMLNKQTCPVNRIILMNTEEIYYTKFVSAHRSISGYRNLSVSHVSEKEFDHGGTRAAAVARSQADYFICMTDDAVPADDRLIENLLKPILSGEASFSYARQLAREGAGPIEQYTRCFNYPEESQIKCLASIDSLGIKTYFFSNVCAAYDRKIYEELGGFEKHIIFNEDMVFAAHAVKAGYKIAYAADARVVHSHSYKCREQFRRNFDLGVSQVMYPEVFDELPSVGEGKKLIKKTNEYLRETGNRRLILGNYVKSGFKYLGYQFGRHYKKLPRNLIDYWTMNNAFWEREYYLNACAMLEDL